MTTLYADALKQDKIPKGFLKLSKGSYRSLDEIGEVWVPGENTLVRATILPVSEQDQLGKGKIRIRTRNQNTDISYTKLLIYNP